MTLFSAIGAVLLMADPASADPEDPPVEQGAPAPAPASAAQGVGTPGSDANLAQQVANPVAELISVPLQSNLDCCFGPADANRYTLNIQPVIPVRLNSELSLITRTILPFIAQERTVSDGRGTNGFGDITQSFFFKPQINGITIAAGPAVVWPIGNKEFGSGKWSAGPTALVVKQTPKGTTLGMLANHLWSYAGKDDRPGVSATLLQPFVTQTFHNGMSIGANTEASYNWKQKQWTVPIDITLGQLVRIGRQPMQISMSGKYYAERPSGGPDWGLRLTLTFLFPE